MLMSHNKLKALSFNYCASHLLDKNHTNSSSFTAKSHLREINIIIAFACFTLHGSVLLGYSQTQRKPLSVGRICTKFWRYFIKSDPLLYCTV